MGKLIEIVGLIAALGAVACGGMVDGQPGQPTAATGVEAASMVAVPDRGAASLAPECTAATYSLFNAGLVTCDQAAPLCSFDNAARFHAAPLTAAAVCWCEPGTAKTPGIYGAYACALVRS